MASVSLKQTLEYFEIQESLEPESFTKYHLCIKEYFDMFSLPRFHKRKIKLIIHLANLVIIF